MKKLYLAKQTNTVMFVSDLDDPNFLTGRAKLFLKEEEKNCASVPIDVQEVTSLEQIPNEWSHDNLLWGTDEEITAHGFLNLKSENSRSYQEYLRLKAIFE